MPKCWTEVLGSFGLKKPSASLYPLLPRKPGQAFYNFIELSLPEFFYPSQIGYNPLADFSVNPLALNDIQVEPDGAVFIFEGFRPEIHSTNIVA